MKKSDFYYDLPEELIAQTPIEPITIEGQSGGPYKLVQCGVNGHGSH